MRNMVRSFVLAAALLSLAGPGVAGDAKKFHPDFRVKNPTSWSFPFPLAEVRAKAREAFSLDHQIAHPVPLAFSTPMMNTLDMLTVDDVEKGGALQATFKDSNDIHLNDLRDVLWYSMIYGGKEAVASFVIHFDPAGEKTTRVTVTAVDPKVIDGLACCGPHGLYARYVPAAATTHEEYTILRYLGEFLGVKMPPPIIPH